jgi:hypothetical protein
LQSPTSHWEKADRDIAENVDLPRHCSRAAAGTLSSARVLHLLSNLLRMRGCADWSGLCHTRNAYDFAKESVVAANVPGYPPKRNKLWKALHIIHREWVRNTLVPTQDSEVQMTQMIQLHVPRWSLEYARGTSWGQELALGKLRRRRRRRHGCNPASRQFQWKTVEAFGVAGKLLSRGGLPPEAIGGDGDDLQAQIEAAWQRLVTKIPDQLEGPDAIDAVKQQASGAERGRKGDQVMAHSCVF